MNNIHKFEEQYILFKTAVYGKPAYNQEIVSKALDESKNALFSILKEKNIEYEAFFLKELIDIYERKHKSNPNHLPFSDAFQTGVYSDFCEKLSYLDFLFEKCPIKIDVDFHLLKIAERTLNNDSVLHFYTLFDTFNMLYLKEVQRENVPFLFQVISLLIDKTDKNHFSTDIYVRVDCLIMDYYEPKYHSIIEKGRNHHDGAIKDYFRIPQKYQ